MAEGTFANHPTLVETLPPLVRKQRRLEAKVAAVAQDAKDEKACRAEIDVLLVAAGLQKSDVVTCAGYDARHSEKAGQESLNAETLTAQLLTAGLHADAIVTILKASTDVGQAAKFATVTPSKGAKVRV